MPVLDTYTLCNTTPGSANFQHTNPLLHPQAGTPDWFSMELTGFDLISGDALYTYYVDPVITPGLYIITIVDGGENVVGTIEITVQECNPDYEHAVCVGEFTNVVGPIDNPPTEFGDEWHIWSAPNWFELTGTAGAQGYMFIPPQPGAYWVILQAGLDENAFMRILIVVTTDCVEVAEGCGPFYANIIWFALVGGWQPYVFRKARTLGNDTGQMQTFKHNGVLKAVSKKEVYDNVVVVSGYLPAGHVEYLRRLKNSIQAFEYNPITMLYDIPILIDQGEFTWKKEGNGLYEYNFKYSYATEVIIQNQ